MRYSTVSVIRCSDYLAGDITRRVEQCISELGGIEQFVCRGDTVLLKPNFIAPKPRRCAVQTDPELILAIAKIVKDCGGKPFIGDSPAWGDVSACIKVLELEEPLKKLGIPVKQLNKPKRLEIAGSKIGISRVALEADKIINMPKFKSHQQIAYTFAVKNMYGCVSGKEKAFWHFAKGKSCHDFCLMLIEIYKRLNPVLTIIDGVIAMEGNGPIHGDPKPLGVLVAGTDPIACETVCCELINVSAQKLPIIQTARQVEFGCSELSQIKVVGDGYLDSVCADFKAADQVPLRFSLRQVFKSLCKQVICLCRRR